MKRWMIGLCVALLVSVPARAAGVESAVGPGMPLALAVKEKVQKELGLNAAQAAAVKNLHSEAIKDSQSASAAIDKLGKVLKADQVNRLKEISYQVRGGAAILDDDVSKALGLTDKQKAACAKIWSADEATLQDFLARARFRSKEARDTYIATQRKATGDKMLAAVDDKQRKQFAVLQGKAFDTTGLNQE